MAKLSEADKRQITIESAAGSKVSELAEKFQVSHTAISKILKERKSCEKLREVSNAAEAPYREKAHKIIGSIIDDLPQDLKKATLRDKMTVLEKMIVYYGTPQETGDSENRITIEIEDASGED